MKMKYSKNYAVLAKVEIYIRIEESREPNITKNIFFVYS